MVQGNGLEYFTFKPKLKLPDDAEVVFVSDMFVDDYVGGAELTSEALIGASPFKVFKLHSRDVSIELLQAGYEKYWIFGNFANLDANLIPTIVANMSYSILEYDYKYCRYRSPEKHEVSEHAPCMCHDEQHGKMVSAFMYGAKSLWWMSEQQKLHYEKLFPFLVERPSTVLSSVFDEETFATIHILQEKYKDQPRSGWIILGSPSWVKGSDAATNWCIDNGKTYEVIWGLTYSETLRKLAQAEGFVYMPNGRDTCPRMVIEAKLLGCKLQLNEYVQHSDEEWFKIDDVETTESYLYMARSRFWNGIYSDMGEEVTTLSGYTTTYNCIESDYPYVESIVSMLGVCDEVVVVDSGSTDGTWDELVRLASVYDKLIIHKQPRDRSKKRWAIDFDGRQKALARSLCTSAFCWQQDSDEVIHENDYDKIKKIVKHFPKGADLLCLPVIEYWGSTGKVRADIHNWKWRLSRNRPGLTHGIPAQLRRYDDDGELYAARGTDSCDYVILSNYNPVRYVNFYDSSIDSLRQKALAGDVAALDEYEKWYNVIVDNLPAVHHYSWFNIERKIRSYRSYWARFWESMYNEPQVDTSENNMFFDKPWSDVTDEDVHELAGRLETQMGGWIFHRKVDFSSCTPSISCDRTHPVLIDEWIERNQ